MYWNLCWLSVGRSVVVDIGAGRLKQQNRFDTACSLVCLYARACVCLCVYICICICVHMYVCKEQSRSQYMQTKRQKKMDRLNLNQMGEEVRFQSCWNENQTLLPLISRSLIFYSIFGFVTCCSKYNRAIAIAIAQKHTLHSCSSFAIRLCCFLCSFFHWPCARVRTQKKIDFALESSGLLNSCYLSNQ